MGARADRTTLLAAVDESIAAGDLGRVEAGGGALARRYAEQIDTSDDVEPALEKLGPRLLATLPILGLPAPRAAAKATDEPKTLDPLAAIRARRRTG